jgi:hypothetical protein
MVEVTVMEIYKLPTVGHNQYSIVKTSVADPDPFDADPRILFVTLIRIRTLLFN